jgi:D-alanyl-lipoteichoic acid acyltransferase DltB (MBOAT superfamily)
VYFTSIPFIAFLCLTLLVYYILPRRARWVLLLAASLGFYAFSGWDNLCYMAFVILSSYAAGCFIQKTNDQTKAYLAEHKDLPREEKKAYRAAQKRKSTAWLVTAMLLNFGVLAAVKILALPQIGGIFTDYVMPMGISFFTFRTMGYLIDVYRGKHPAQCNLAKLALFTSFFPAVIQGPISRYDSLSKTLFEGTGFSLDVFGKGAERIIWGYFKKLVIADRLLVMVGTLTGTPGEYEGLYTLLSIVIYAAALYCDFTGGIDITIGIGETMGITQEENFLSPFRSLNIFDYWRRWHITMGTWFKDYIFYPISVARPMMKLTKWCKKHLGDKTARRVPVYIATLVTWFATGIWHGASWNFIAWGIANALVIVASQELQPLYQKFHLRFPKMKGKGYDSFQIIRTFILMSFIRAFDIYPGVIGTLKQLSTIFWKPSPAKFIAGGLTSLGLDTAGLIAAAAGLAIVIASSFIKKRPPAIVFALLVIAILIFGVYGLGFDAAQFIYNRF